ncbi:MAG: GIY-YIG nuclease family protein [Patescibacteria group bacterium]|nr:GIY-YIG nuclease family protein [Patescibacteria group bacterium]MCL5262126.1 GIY-YIG nuclease family protein [Patescibacteria group bacterium]
MKKLYENFPDTPGVYLMKNAAGEVVYVGKAANLKRRVSSYFTRPHESRIEKLVSEIKKIDYRKTDTALEALILEARLIKEYRPFFNIKDKDDKSFLYFEITKEDYPRVMFVRGKKKAQGERFGPFTSASSAREAAKILRRIFPWSIHPPERIGQAKRPCFDFEIGLCPGTCSGLPDKKAYRKNIVNLKMFLRGKKKALIASLQKEMKTSAKNLDFEKAEKIKRQIFSLTHIQDIALIKETAIASGEKPAFRVEGYDVSNISGDSAVGSMVVWENGALNNNEYRKFRIKTIGQANDTGMIKEMISRRLKNDWPLPNLILVDGGLGQMSAARAALEEAGLKIPVLGIAKGPSRKADRLIGSLPSAVSKDDLLRLRDEAHRFAISYHKKLRNAKFIEL